MRRVAPGHASEPARRFGIWRWGAAAVLTAAALACPPPAAASAATVEQVITGEHLRLVSVTNPAMASLSPGESASWDVGVSVMTDGDATVDVTVSVDAATPDTFSMDVLRCDERWTAQGCAPGAVSLTTAPVTPGASTALGSTDADDAPWFRITVTMTGDADRAQASLRLTADGVGEQVSTGTDPGTRPPSSPLPGTGISVLGHTALAAVAVLTGLALAALARSRSRRSVS